MIFRRFSKHAAVLTTFVWLTIRKDFIPDFPLKNLSMVSQWMRKKAQMRYSQTIFLVQELKELAEVKLLRSISSKKH
jgi:uncharacterized protein Usg